MKKNILTIIIMATCLVNLVMNVVLVFSIMPAMNKTSNLVDKVASVVDLEIEDANKEEEEYTIQDLVTFDIAYETSVKINLQSDEGDSKAHYAVLDGVVVSFNSKAEDFEAINTSVQTNPVYVNDIVKETISGYTVTTINEATVRQEVIKKIQEKYNSKCIVDVSLTGFLTA
ncbi:MAG: hypothetical protein K6G62_07840 [Eubacterium sp.]|nr:hypothetical protein [Eubacterium sp.]